MMIIVCVCDTYEVMILNWKGKKDIFTTLEPSDFHKLQISNEKYGSELVLPLHKNTLENDGSSEGLCSSEGDA
jgi:hypothetical protein